jgi:hypothetical protein
MFLETGVCPFLRRKMSISRLNGALKKMNLFHIVP